MALVRSETVRKGGFSFESFTFNTLGVILIQTVHQQNTERRPTLMGIRSSEAKQATGILFEIMDGEVQIARGYLYILGNMLHQRPFGFMEDIFVHPDHRGKGLGTQIVDAIIEAARSAGCYKLIATSRSERERVHTLYRELGFQAQGLEFRMNFE